MARRFPRAGLAAGAIALCVLASGCARLERYQGVNPAPGSIRAFDGGVSPAGALPVAPAPGGSEPGGPAPGGHGPRAEIVPGTTDAASRFAGQVRSSATGEHFSILVFGDNRPGFRMEANSPAYRPVKNMSLTDPGRFARGLLWLPVFVVNAFIPTLDGPRDLVTWFTKRPRGGGESRVLRALTEQLPADLAISTGDVVQDGRRGRQWEDFAEHAGELRSRVMLFAAPGNHERMHDSNGAAAWSAVMGAPAAPGRWWYALDVPECGARFVFLDSNILTDVHDRIPDVAEGALADEQLAWADSVLAEERRFKFVVFHHPLVSAGHYTRDWGGDRDTPAARRRARLFEMFSRSKITAVLAGHEHLYHRAWVSTPHGGFWHVTTAGGGAPLYRIDGAGHEWSLRQPVPGGLSIPAESAFTRTTYNFCRLELPRVSAPEAAPRFEAFAVGGGGRVAPLDSLPLLGGPGLR